MDAQNVAVAVAITACVAYTARRLWKLLRAASKGGARCAGCPLADTCCHPPSANCHQAPPANGCHQAPPANGCHQAPPANGCHQAPPANGCGCCK